MRLSITSPNGIAGGLSSLEYMRKPSKYFPISSEDEEDPLLVPEVSKKKIDQLLSTSAKTMRSSTVQNVLKGLNAKVQELEGDYINQLQELTDEENKNKDYLTIIKQVEKQTKTKILDDDRQVLPDVLKRAKDVALVDTFDTD